MKWLHSPVHTDLSAVRALMLRISSVRSAACRLSVSLLSDFTRLRAFAAAALATSLVASSGFASRPALAMDRGGYSMEILVDGIPPDRPIPKNLQTLITQMLEPDASNRPQSMDEVKQTLQGLKEHSVGQRVKRMLAFTGGFLTNSGFWVIPLMAVLLSIFLIFFLFFDFLDIGRQVLGDGFGDHGQTPRLHFLHQPPMRPLGALRESFT